MLTPRSPRPGWMGGLPTRLCLPFASSQSRNRSGAHLERMSGLGAAGQAEKIMGVMIRAWDQARATGPRSVRLRDRIAASAHDFLGLTGSAETRHSLQMCA